VNDASAVAQEGANNAALTAALEKTLSRDGTGPNSMGADLDMNSHRLLNLPAPRSGLEPLRLMDVNTTVTVSGALAKANNLSDVLDPALARTNLNLGNVDNTSDATKNAATAMLTNKTLSGTITGSIGINNTAPAAPLEIGDPNILNASGRIRSSTHDSGAGYRSWDIGADFATFGNYGFNVKDVGAASTRMSIDLTGRVGLNTVTPSNDLTVLQRSDSQTTGGLKLYRASGASSASLFQGSDDNSYLINNGTGGVLLYTNVPTVLAKQGGGVQFPSYGAGVLQSDAAGNITASAMSGGRLTGAIYVEDYCACNGSTDDAAGLNAAFAATPSSGTLIFPASKTVFLGSGVTLSKSLNILGNNSILYATSTAMTAMMTINSAAGELPYIRIDGLNFTTTTVSSIRGIYTVGTGALTYLVLTNMRMLGGFYDALSFASNVYFAQITNNLIQGNITNIRTAGMGQSIISGNRMGTGASGAFSIYMNGAIGDMVISNNQCEGFNGGTGNVGMRLIATAYGGQFHVVGNKFDTSQYGIIINGVINSSFTSNGFINPLIADGVTITANTIARTGPSGNIYMNTWN
jgi:hypothetical protein